MPVNAFFDSQNWRIGQFENGSLVTKAVGGAGSLSPQVDAEAIVVIDGDTASIWSGGQMKLEFDFNEDLSIGQIGLGTSNAIATFDDFEVRHASGVIEGMKWDDLDGDGVFDPEIGESPAPGWTIFLDHNRNGMLDEGEPSQRTNANGRYAFTNLLPGQYEVAEVMQPGWNQTFSLLEPIDESGQWTVELGPAETRSNINFGNRDLSLALLPIEEPFAGGVPPYFEAATGTWNVVAGRYEAAADPADERAVSLVRTALPLPGAVEVEVTMADGDGVYHNGIIVFDYQGPDDFKFAGACFGAKNWRIGRFVNGAFVNENIAADASLAKGLEVEASVVITGERAAVWSGGQKKVEFDFGQTFIDGQIGLGTINAITAFDDLEVRRRYGLIGGQVWEDVNGDGAFDPESGESQIAGLTVYLDLNGNGQRNAWEPAQVTDENGRYQFTDLVSGSYDVRHAVPEGWVGTFPDATQLLTHHVDLNPGGIFSAANFGIQNKIVRLFPIRDDFDDGAARHLIPVKGQWTVVDGAYVGKAGLTGKSVSVVETGLLLPTPIHVEATMEGRTGSADRSINAFFVFDYQSARQFKFAGPFFGSGTWRIGVFQDGSFINNAVVVDESLAPDEPLEVRLILTGTNVAVWSDGQLKVEFDFDDLVADGQVGFGTRGAISAFDDLLIDAQGTAVPHADDFDDGVAYYLTGVMGSWSVNEGRLIGVGQGPSDAIALLQFDKRVPGGPVADGILEMSAVMSSSGGQGRFSNGFFVFDDVDAGNFKFAGVFFGAGEFRIGKVEDGQ